VTHLSFLELTWCTSSRSTIIVLVNIFIVYNSILNLWKKKKEEIHSTKIKHFDKFSITHVSRMKNDYVPSLLDSKRQYNTNFYTIQDHRSVGRRSLSAGNSRRWKHLTNVECGKPQVLLQLRNLFLMCFQTF